MVLGVGEVRHPIEEGEKEEGEKEEKGKKKGETFICPSLSTRSNLCFPCCTRTGGCPSPLALSAEGLWADVEQTTDSRPSVGVY